MRVLCLDCDSQASGQIVGFWNAAALLEWGLEAGRLLWPRGRCLKVVHSQIQLYLEDLPSRNHPYNFSLLALWMNRSWAFTEDHLDGVCRRFLSFPNLRQEVTRKLKVLRRHDLACACHPKYLHVSGMCFHWVGTQRGHWGSERKGGKKRP